MIYSASRKDRNKMAGCKKQSRNKELYSFQIPGLQSKTRFEKQPSSKTEICQHGRESQNIHCKVYKRCKSLQRYAYLETVHIQMWRSPWFSQVTLAWAVKNSQMSPFAQQDSSMLRTISKASGPVLWSKLPWLQANFCKVGFL